jgi:putative flippase GtrA
VSYVHAAFARLRRAAHELTKFASIGAIALVVNMLVTNLVWKMDPQKPIIGSIVGTVIATIVAYLGNRFWTYKDRDSIGRSRELVLFFAVNGIGMLIETVPLAISQYVMHFDGTLANNVAKYMFGMPLGMLFRLWTYRTWIFPKVDPAVAAPQFQFETAEAVAHVEPLPTSQLPDNGGRHRRSGSGELLNTTRW